MRTWLMLTIGLAIAAFANTAQAQLDDRCKPQLQQWMANIGMKSSDVPNAQWSTVMRSSNQVTNYIFEGTPSSCSSGQVVVEFWPNCQVQDAYTTGSCEVKGVHQSTW